MRQALFVALVTERRVIRVTAVVVVLATAMACSSSSPEAPAPPLADVPPVEEDSGVSVPSADAARETEADAGIELEMINDAVGGPGASCETVCAKASYTCVVACPGYNGGLSAGQASYLKDSRLTEHPIPTCTSAPPASTSDGSLTGYGCCCATPPHERVPGSISAPTTCDALCQSKGLRCDPYTQWTSMPDEVGAFGGIHYVYTSPGKVKARSGACDEVPPLVSSGALTLSSVVCGCIR